MTIAELEAYLRAQRVLQERLRAQSAGRFAYVAAAARPPARWVHSEYLTLVAAPGGELVYLPSEDPRVDATREPNKCTAYYAE